MGGHFLFAEGETATLEIPAELFAQLEKESKRRRKSIVRVLAEYLEDMEDGREAERRMKDVRSGKVKTEPWEEVKKRLLEAS